MRRGWSVQFSSHRYLHSLDILIDAALAELVEAAASGLRFVVNASADLAEQGVLLDLLEQAHVY